MKVALLTDGIHPFVIGGMQTHSFYLARYLAVNKIYVDLYHPNISIDEDVFYNCFTKEEAIYINPVFVEFPKSHYYPGHYVVSSYRYSKNIFKKYIQFTPPDFVYAQGFAGWELIKQKKYSKMFIPPIGVNFHGLNMFQPVFSLKDKLTNLLFRKPVEFNLNNADCVFSLGENLSNLIKSNAKNVKTVVEIPVGVDEKWLVEKFRLKNNKEISFVFVGRYDKIKGIDLLNRSLLKLIENGLKFEFNFIGPFPEEVKLRATNIVYHNEIKDFLKLKSLIAKSDVIISSSYSEGMPTVIIEAMACGLAVIATDVGVVNELVDVQNGLLIPAGSELAIKNAMSFFINMDAEQLLKMKVVSCEKVKSKFLWKNVIELTILEIKKIIK